MKKYGLIGCPLGHSFSESYFNEKFENEHIDAQYFNYEIGNVDCLIELINSHPTLQGLNVTIPYKEQVLRYIDEMSDEAQAIGAVNVIRIERDAHGLKLKGYNSDVIGFTQSIEPLLTRRHKKALILGTGGSSKAVEYGLRKLGLDTLLVSRRPQGKEKSTPVIAYGQITPQTLNDYPVIVNCTPVGMYPHADECPDLPYEALGTHNLLYDLIYNPDETVFLKKGREQGATTKNGLEMLLLQAFASWEIWNQ